MSSRIFICSDLHLGHDNMAIHRGFKDAMEQDAYIIERWNKVVTKRDIVYVLGDISMENKRDYPILAALNGRIKVVGGNHDMPNHTKDLLLYVESISGIVKLKKKGYPAVFLTHAPIHPRELDFRVDFNIHGHTHEYLVEKPDGTRDERYINVCLENIDYTPQLFTDLMAKHYGENRT